MRTGSQKPRWRCHMVFNGTVMAWDLQDIKVLRDLIFESDDVDLSALPSAIPVPELISTYPVWAIDAKGQALVGQTTDEIEDLSSILDWYAEDNIPPQDFSLKGYDRIEKLVTPGSKTSSRVYVPKSWQGKRVAVIRLDP